MSITPNHTPLTAVELHQLAELERLMLEEGPILTNGEASDLADLRNRRDGADPLDPRWDIREMWNQDCVVIDLEEEARTEADLIARCGDYEEPGT
jgi:hypothetical protein